MMFAGMDGRLIWFLIAGFGLGICMIALALNDKDR
jgi:hypothetical protein